MDSKLIFLDASDLNSSIYRIFKFDRLLQIFQQRLNVLVKPALWDDPFENFILNSIGILPDGNQVLFGNRDNYYGQCWSRTKESDAMWRIYSEGKDGVKVKTSIINLLTPLFQSSNNSSIDPYIGKVKYLGKKRLESLLRNRINMTNKLNDLNKGQASTFFFKRWAFRHENEVRIIVKKDQDNIDNIFSYACNPFLEFEELVFDPRMSRQDFLVKKHELQVLGFTGKIIQSGLYRFSPLNIDIDYYQEI